MTALVRLRIQPPIKSCQQWVKLIGLMLKLGNPLKLLDLIDQDEDLSVVHRINGVTVVINKPEATHVVLKKASSANFRSA
jgi:hypothetical protein